MVGLWGDEEATRERIVGGWVLTGDVGRLDRNGYLYISDRKDDLIISGGFNIWPLELERVIAEDPRILEVAVFGVPDDKWGETPLALCVVADPASITEDEVIGLCAERLGSYKKPGRVVLQTAPCRRASWGNCSARCCGSRTGPAKNGGWPAADRRGARFTTGQVVSVNGAQLGGSCGDASG